jgi:hypothetical protein
MMKIYTSALRIALTFSAICVAQADTFQVTISDQLKNQAGFLAFDFLAGSPAPNNTVVISNFSTDGTLSSNSQSGSASGTLAPGPLTLSDASFFNEFLQGLTYGTVISFQFTVGNNSIGNAIPDNFSFYLLDNNKDPYQTSDTVANSLFSIDLDGPGSTPVVYTSSYAQAQVTPANTIVPEPPLAPLTLALLGCVIYIRRGERLS